MLPQRTAALLEKFWIDATVSCMTEQDIQVLGGFFLRISGVGAIRPFCGSGDGRYSPLSLSEHDLTYCSGVFGLRYTLAA